LNITHNDAAALLTQADVDPTRRAETLTLAEWAAVSRLVAARLEA